MIAMITVVCVYNNRKTFAGCLLKSLKIQTAKHERIMIDNTHGEFESAAKALNYGGRKARGKYILFVHQDVGFSSPGVLGAIEKALDALPNLGIAGVAGNSGEIRRTASNIRHGRPLRAVGRMRVDAPMKVQTLDECLVVVPRKVFKTLKFDEHACSGWHLYAVDYSLSAKKLGFDAYVLPVTIRHLSKGAMDKNYYLSLRKVLKKHNNAGWIYTTNGFWNACAPISLQRIRCFQLLAMGMMILLNDGVLIFFQDLHWFLFVKGR